MDRILVVDDSLDAPSRLALAGCQGEFDMVQCTSMGEAKELLHRNNIHAVLMDLTMRDAIFPNLFNQIKEASRFMPVVVCTSAVDPLADSCVMKFGTVDFLVNGFITAQAICDALRKAIKVGRTIAGLERINGGFRDREGS